MAEAYDDAAVRHWSDAEFCKSDQRHPNADQLYGFATECAIKHALGNIPVFLSGGALQKQYKRHIDELWDVISLQSIRKSASALAALSHMSPSPFADWSVDQRYESGEAITLAIVEKHRKAASRVLGAVGLLGVRRGA
jgi:hypothetical protein